MQCSAHGVDVPVEIDDTGRRDALRCADGPPMQHGGQTENVWLPGAETVCGFIVTQRHISL